MKKLRHQAGPAGLVIGPQPRSVVAVEIFVKQHQIPPMGIVLQIAGPENGAPSRTPRKKMDFSRRESSGATSQRAFHWPEPVGHSTRKSSP